MSDRPKDYYFWMKDWADSSGYALSDVYYPIAVDAQFPTFVARIPRGRVFGDDGTVISPNNVLIWETSYDWSNDPHKHPIFLQQSLPPTEYVPGNIAVLTKIGSSNYYHWMYDVLPRIYTLWCSRIPVDRYIVSEHLQPFQYETLGMLGITADRLIHSNRQFHIEADHLLVPSIGFGQKWCYHFLRSEFLPHEPRPSRRLYVSRGHSVGRTITNEEEVVRVLQSYGFETVYPEHLSVRDQINLFSEASHVIAPTGSALTNLTFCSSQTKVLEFFSPNFIVHDIKRICGYGGLQHFEYIGVGSRPPSYEGIPWYWAGLDNIFVSIADLRHLCKQMGL
ncbi:glycosyltransferase family 61 protein [Paenibacillus montanisoli]|uniref:Glycosyltransferase family 61 protein n=1 Tax=Paenibacillus montanisoli TaxID=2081970 RepID=A0A328U425_9BACL|nr:glycosyltransferase family 61 protein [Paenibacillus montanisoli]RAP76802.1 glycosyltransferase family 61 protein [Paenibacillus montanisoli]